MLPVAIRRSVLLFEMCRMFLFVSLDQSQAGCEPWNHEDRLVGVDAAQMSLLKPLSWELRFLSSSNNATWTFSVLLLKAPKRMENKSASIQVLPLSPQTLGVAETIPRSPSMPITCFWRHRFPVDSTPLYELVDGDEQSSTPPHLDVVKAGTSSTRYVPASPMTT